MARRLPPLNAIRAFEAAARHLSFTKAAQELHVTQAAISHQVKSLEGVLGLQLFRRLNRRLILSDAGQTYLPPLREALDKIQAATDRLQAIDTSGTLRVSVLLSFAAKWLLPRLPRFRERYPEIDLLMSADDRLIDFHQGDVDLGIRYGEGRYPGLRVDVLMRDDSFPICSPKLLEGEHPLREPADLRYHTLLHETSRGTADDPDWHYWLKVAGVSDVDPERGPGFSHMSMALEAAIAGQGVALARSSLAEEDIAAGRLVRPFGPNLPSSWVYSVVSLPQMADLPKVKLFREWLLEEVASGKAGLDLRPIASSKQP